MTRTYAFVLAILTATIPACAEGDWKDSLESALKTDIQFTKFGSHGSLATIGSRYTLAIDNIQGMPTDGGYVANINVVENGTRREANLAERTLVGIFNAGTRKTQGMQVESGSKIGVMKVNVSKDAVAVEIVTLKAEKITMKGNTESEYLYTWLQFPLRGLESMEATAVKQVIYAAIVPDNVSALTSATQPISPSGRPAAKPDAGVPPASSQLIGKTADEVRALLGAPNSVLEAGGQQIYIYSQLGLRISFRDGRVAGAQ